MQALGHGKDGREPTKGKGGPTKEYFVNDMGYRRDHMEVGCSHAYLKQIVTHFITLHRRTLKRLLVGSFT